MTKKLLTLSLLLLALIACGLNDNPPEYVKELVAYEEGDGLIIYFILADASGAMTRARGRASLTITQTTWEWDRSLGYLREQEQVLYNVTVRVDKSDFRKATVGLGLFQREVILYSFGRIPYSRFWRRPEEGIGKVRLAFHCSSGVLEAQETVFF